MLSTGNQLRAGRALVGIEQVALAELAGVHVNTIRKMEAAGAQGLPGHMDTVRKLQQALEKAGVEFLNHGQPGVRLAAPMQTVGSPRHFHEGTGGVSFDVQRDGRRFTIRVSREILNDLARDNEGSGDGLVAAFERFRPQILSATKRAIEQGRDEGGALVLAGGDFPS